MKIQFHPDLDFQKQAIESVTEAMQACCRICGHFRKRDAIANVEVNV